MKLTANFLYYDKENLNGRIYTKECAEDMIRQFKMRNKDFPMIGELNMSNDKPFENPGVVNLHNASHKVIELHINEDTKSLDGTLQILDNSKGNILRKLVEQDMTNMISASSRGIGTVNSKTKEIEDYQLLSFDIIPKSESSFKGTITMKDI